MTVRLGTLALGSRFRFRALTGELVSLSGGSATVKLDAESRKRFVARDGETPREVEFVGGSARQTWSLNTLVEVIHA